MERLKHPKVTKSLLLEIKSRISNNFNILILRTVQYEKPVVTTSVSDVPVFVILWINVSVVNIFPDTEVAVLALQTVLDTGPGDPAPGQPAHLGRGHHGRGTGQAPRLSALLPVVGVPQQLADVRPLGEV